ncbi:MAG: tetratricopeptide repeat protein, partial [Synergistaceae bacterium]|nr:tetratricopeptide repeat protein [Synergistaceae bacterium]
MPDDAENLEIAAPEGEISSGGRTSLNVRGGKMPSTLFWTAVIIVFALIAAGIAEYNRGSFTTGWVLKRANEVFEKGDYELAAEQYREVLELMPDLDGVHYRLAYANEMLGRYIEAVDSYAVHLENNPWDTEALVRLASIYLRFDMYNDAMLLFEEAADRLPDDPEVRYALSIVYERAGRSEKAAESYVRLTGLNIAKNPELLINSSRSLMKLGQYADALEGFTRANELLPADDRRAFHGMNAARNMLGWPTDDAVVMMPGQSIGEVAIGDKSSDVLKALGKPVDLVVDGDHELWSYGAGQDKISTYVFFQDGIVIE